MCLLLGRCCGRSSQRACGKVSCRTNQLFLHYSTCNRLNKDDVSETISPQSNFLSWIMNRLINNRSSGISQETPVVPIRLFVDEDDL